MKKITDVGSRSGKTFFQSFLATLIVEAGYIIYEILWGTKVFDFENAYTWLNWVVTGIAIGLIASAISLIQNAIINLRFKRHAEKKGGRK